MVEDAKDGVQQIFAAGKEQAVARLSNPVIGPFLLSWAFCNYRIFFALFSGEPLHHRFAVVDALTTPWEEYLLGRGLMLPLVVTLGYIFLVPMAVEGVLRWNLKMQRRQKAAEQRSQGLELLSEAQSSHLYALRQEKERQLNELKTKLRLAESRLSGWRAMVKSSGINQSESSDAALRAFLMSQEFDVHEPNVVSRPIAVLAFGGEDAAHCSDFFVSYAKHIDVWLLSSSTLTLRNSGGEVTGKLTFISDRGVFVGRINGDDVELRGKAFVCE